jgi:hypothetical protein
MHSAILRPRKKALRPPFQFLAQPLTMAFSARSRRSPRIVDRALFLLGMCGRGTLRPALNRSVKSRLSVIALPPERASLLL